MMTETRIQTWTHADGSKTVKVSLRQAVRMCAPRRVPMWRRFARWIFS